MEKVYCDSCKKYSIYTTEERIISEFKGYPVHVTEHVGLCSSCGETLYVPALEEQNFRVLYDAYRNAANIVSADAIVALREKYQLSQRELTAILNWGKMTINRYERGAVPSQGHSDYLQLLIANEHEFRKKVEDAYAQKRIKERTVEKVASRALPAGLAAVRRFTIERLTHPESEFNGFRKFDIERTIHLIGYLADRVLLLKTSMNKFLWYIDFLCFKEHQRSITGLQYMRYTHGPIIENFTYEELLVYFEETFEKEDIEEGEWLRTAIHSKKNYDLSLFKEREQIIIDRVIEKFATKSVSEITTLSHQERAWQELGNRALISYDRWAPELRVIF